MIDSEKLRWNIVSIQPQLCWTVLDTDGSWKSSAEDFVGDPRWAVAHAVQLYDDDSSSPVFASTFWLILEANPCDSESSRWIEDKYVFFSESAARKRAEELLGPKYEL